MTRGFEFKLLTLAWYTLSTWLLPTWFVYFTGRVWLDGMTFIDSNMSSCLCSFYQWLIILLRWFDFADSDIRAISACIDFHRVLRRTRTIAITHTHCQKIVNISLDIPSLHLLTTLESLKAIVLGGIIAKRLTTRIVRDMLIPFPALKRNYSKLSENMRFLIRPHKSSPACRLQSNALIISEPQIMHAQMFPRKVDHGSE